MNDWFTADPHINHTNIIRYSNRPFETVEEMNGTIIDNWNARVKPGDRVFFLGDLGMFRSTEDATKVVRSLNGQKFFIFGNHDRKHIRNSEGWQEKDYYRRMKINGQVIVMFHYPLLTWDRSHYGSWMLHGHCHGSLQPTNQPRLDVGVDVHGFVPINFDEVASIMKERQYTPVDHHTS